MTRDAPDSVPGAEHAEWVVDARRFTPLVDGIEYFRAVRRALVRARRQVLIVGWDLHSEIDLLRGEEARAARRDEPWPVRLADLLLAMVDCRDELDVRLLIWAGNPLYAFERQHLPRMKLPWSGHPRIILAWDRDTPALASQHQKLVVVDDRVAFSGGMDLTRSRWDDHDHQLDDARRRVPGLLPSYSAPYHEVMVAVDDVAAATLGAQCRERWRRATGEALAAPAIDDAGHDPWPEGVAPLLERRPVALALTEPAHAGRPARRQVEASWLAQVRAARRLVFIENQYFTHGGLAEALADRLREPDGPEIVLILPYGCPEALQSMAMDPRRDELLDQLRTADPGGRLGVYWPTLCGGARGDVGDVSVYVHAKTMVVDDRLLRVGSANATARSMGLDTELDVFTGVDSDDEAGAAAIAGYRRRLLAYLLGVEPAAVARAENDAGSVVGAIEALRGGEQSLHPFEHRADGLGESLSLPYELADPGAPLDEAAVQRILETLKAETGLVRRVARARHIVIGAVRRSWWIIGFAIAAVLLAALWSLTPLGELVDGAMLRRGAETIRSSPVGVGGAVLAFAVLATVGFPVTLLIVATGAAFDVRWSIPICVAGIALSSSAGFAVGRRLPFDLGAARRLARATRLLARRGVLAVVILRNLPIAPYAVVNVACGLSPLSWWRYLLGTLLGMLPGVVVVGFFGRAIGDLIAEPTPRGLGLIAGAAALLIVLAVGADAALRRWMPRLESGGADESRDGGETGRDVAA